MTDTSVRRLEILTSVVISVVVLAALAWRVFHAGPLWRDECALVQLARMPDVRAIFAEFTHEAFPPPFPLLIRFWTLLFGPTDASLRLYGFVVSVGLIAALWVVFYFLRAGVPLLSLPAIGLSSTFLLWGTSVRGYGIGAVFGLLAFAGIGRMIVNAQPRSFVFALLACVLSVQVLLQNCVLIAAIGLSAAAVFSVRKDRARLVDIAVIVSLSLLSFAPYLRSYLQANSWSIVVQSPEPATSIITQTQDVVGHLPAIVVRIALIAIVCLVAFIFVKLFGRDGQERLPNRREITIYVLLTLCCTIAGFEIFLRLLKYARQPWYFLGPFAVVCAAVDLLIAGLLLNRWLRLSRVALAVLISALLVWTNYPQLNRRQTNIDVMARMLTAGAGPDDLIIVDPWQLGVSFNRYYQGNVPWITVPEIEDHRIHRYDLLKARMASANPLDGVFTAAAATLQKGHRIWLAGGAIVPPPGQTAPHLEPAPDPKAVWDNVAYLRAWTLQLGEFVQAHCANVQRVPLPDVGPVNPFEKVPLLVAEGWKD